MTEQTIFFWKSWPSNYRFLFILSLVLLAAALFLYLFQSWIGIDAIIHWQTQNELQEISFELDHFTKGLFDFTADAESYLIIERFVPSSIEVNYIAAYTFAFFFACTLILLLSILPTLPRLWYVISMGLFILLLATFKLDLLQVFHLANNATFIGLLVLYIPVSYYFHAFRPDISFNTRLLCFTLITVVATFILLYFSSISHPLLSVIHHGIILPILISIVFILMIAHEITSGFLYLVTKGGGIGGGNSLLHFSIITFVYLGNLLILYLHNTGVIDWDFLYLNAFYVFVISFVLGLWGFRHRNSLFAHIISVNPYGSFLYVALGTLALATMGYFFASGNDPMIEMLEDVIVYSHLAMGLGFFLYVFVNFSLPMAQGLPVHKVIYQPRRIPFFYVRGIGGIVMLAFFFKASMYPLYQGVAGYYNGIGDAYLAQGNAILAKEYYTLATGYENRNHKSNYALASIAIAQDNPAKAAEYLRKSLEKKPSAYAYAKLSQLYLQEELFFEALFALQRGIRTFPKEGELHNNLALLYARSGIPDSANYYFTLAARFTDQQALVQTNQLALWAKNLSYEALDSVLTHTKPSDYLSLENNRLILANLLNKKDNQPFSEPLQKDSLLKREDFAYLFNYTLNHKDRTDTFLLGQIQKFENDGRNAGFMDDLGFAKACHYFYAHDKNKALDLMDGLQAGNTVQGAYFNKILGIWCLRENASRLAAGRFNKAVQLGDTTMRINEGLALADAGRWESSLAIWQKEKFSPDPQIRDVSKRMEAVMLNQLNAPTDSLDDPGKAIQVYLSDEPLSEVAQRIQDKTYRAIALSSVAKKFITQNKLAEAEKIYQAAKAIGITETGVQVRLNDVYAGLLVARKDYVAVLVQIDKLALSTIEEPRKLYYKAIALENTGKMDEAEKAYNLVLKRLPLDETSIIAASTFFARQKKNPDRAYAILVEAIRINPYSSSLYKAYILQSLDMQLLEYAQKGMEELQNLTTPADYQAFEPSYQAKKASVEKMTADWQ
jgi:predicted Zn-dependent protease